MMVAIFLSPGVQAQLCNGSLGDPVINVTFGAGANPGPALPAGVTTYQYFAADCPQDGLYTIRSRTIACNGSTWHDVTQDHTSGDVNGHMLVVNASMSAGTFYTSKVTGLCSGTTFEFACWVMNVLKPSACSGSGITPNLRFSIETTGGQELGSYSTGNIPATDNPQWKQYGLFFETPPGVTEVVLKIVNNNPGGCGNDLLLDDITFRACGPNIRSAFATATGDEMKLCSNNAATVEMQADLSNADYSSPEIQWQESNDGGLNWQNIPGATGTTLSELNAAKGSYWYRFIAAEAGNLQQATCRVSSNVLRIEVDDPVTSSVEIASPVCEGSPVNFTATGRGDYTWSGPNGYTSTDASPAFTAMRESAGNYTLVRVDEYGCRTEATAALAVHPMPDLSINVASDTVCRNAVLNLQASGAQQYTWYNGGTIIGNAAAFAFTPPADGNTATLSVSGATAEGCKDSLSRVITILDAPLVDAGEDLYVFEGDSTQLKGEVTGSNNYYWTPVVAMNNPAILNPLVAPADNMVYMLTAESQNGCGTSTDNVNVFVYQELELPNAFSPNNDGINDTWIIRAMVSYPNSTVQIFDRYGKTVFESKGYTVPWNGTWQGRMVPAGVYYYVIDLGVANKRLQGSVTVLR